MHCTHAFVCKKHPILTSPCQPSILNPSHASPTPLTQPRQQQTFGQHVPGRAGVVPFLFPIESLLLAEVTVPQKVLSMFFLPGMGFPRWAHGSPPNPFHLFVHMSLCQPEHSDSATSPALTPQPHSPCSAFSVFPAAHLTC